jgi:hypothetical protein
MSLIGPPKYKDRHGRARAISISRRPGTGGQGQFDGRISVAEVWSGGAITVKPGHRGGYNCAS